MDAPDAMNSPASGGSSVTSLSLIARVQAEDSSAWQQLAALYGPLIEFWCRKHGLDKNSAKDCAQDVFLAVLRAIDRYHPPPGLPTAREAADDPGPAGGFRAWLWTITRNKVIDWQRRHNRFPDALGGSTAMHVINQLPERIDDSDASEKTAFNRLLHRALTQVRSEFESKTWQAFWRSTIDGISVASVAQELAISTAAVRQYKARVLRRLRRQLDC